MDKSNKTNQNQEEREIIQEEPIKNARILSQREIKTSREKRPLSKASATDSELAK
jgi:hypothetical protein